MVFPIIMAALAVVGAGARRRESMKQQQELLDLYAKMDGIQRGGYLAATGDRERGRAALEAGHVKAAARLAAPSGPQPSMLQRHRAFLAAELAGNRAGLATQRAGDLASAHARAGDAAQDQAARRLQLLTGATEAMPGVQAQGEAIVGAAFEGLNAYVDAGGTFGKAKKKKPAGAMAFDYDDANQHGGL